MAKKRFEPVVSAEELDKFEQFIFEMDDALEPFIATAAAAGFRLDYSIDSLDTLETFLLSDTANGGDSLIQNRAARYLGEVFRKNVGGQWELCLKDPKYLYFKLPVIAGYSAKPIEFCPIEVIANFIAKRQPGILKRAVESDLEFKE